MRVPKRLLFVQPITTSPAFPNFQKTVLGKVPIGALKGIFTNISPSLDLVPVWGTKTSHRSTWDLMKSGDVVLFVRNNIIEYSSIVVDRAESALMGGSYTLWADSNYSLLIALDEVREFRLPIPQLNAMTGNSSKRVFRALSALSEEGSDRALDQLSGDLGEPLTFSPPIQFNEDAMKAALKKLEDNESSKATVVIRKEQDLLKGVLFQGRSLVECALCGREFAPGPFLWCCHIKPRAKCDALEKVNPSVVTPMCKLGCDDLYEAGFVFVDQCGIIQMNPNAAWTSSLEDYYQSNLVGRACSSFSPLNASFFEWHELNIE